MSRSTSFFASLFPSASERARARTAIAKARRFATLAAQIAETCETFGEDLEAGRVSLVVDRRGITIDRVAADHGSHRDASSSSASGASSATRRTPKAKR